MIKIIFILALCTFSLFGADIKWEKDIASAVDRAAKEKKPLMVLVTKNGCRWCEVLKEKTLKKTKVVSIVNPDFVAYFA